MISWKPEEDEKLKTWYAQANGSFLPYKTMCKILNDEFHGGKNIRNYKSVVKREGQILFGQK